MKIKPLFLAALTLVGCGNSMTPDEKIRMLEGTRQEILADMHRHRSECEAQAIAMANQPGQARFIAACMETYAAIAKQNQAVFADIDRRISEIRPEAPVAGRGAYDDILNGPRPGK